MGEKDNPCCTADALRRIRQVDIGGIVVGLAMLDDIIDEVQGLHRAGKDAIAAKLLKRIAIYNSLPQAAETVYRPALFLEYEKNHMIPYQDTCIRFMKTAEPFSYKKVRS